MPRFMLALLLLAFGAALAPLPLAAQTLTAPTATKTFGASTISLNGTTSLQIIIVNPNAATALTGVAFTDTLPAGMIIASPPVLANLCGGTATATAGGSTLSLSGATVAANSNCQVFVNVTGTTMGIKTNTVQVSSTNGGLSNTASASLTVVGPPAINKAFGTASIPLGGTTTLTFIITNPNATVALTGVAFTDPLPNGSGAPPGGLVVASPNGLTGSCGAGTFTAVAGSGSVSLSGGAIPAGGSCTYSTNVTGNVAGLAENITGNVSSTNGGTGSLAIASVNVIAPPTLSKAFGAASIPLNGTTTLSFHAFNPNPNQGLTGIGFSDTLPAGLVVATPNGLTSTNCTSGTITATAGSGSVSLSGVSLPATEPCNFTINVTGTAAGVENNITSVVTSTENPNGNTANASITVVAPPSIAKVFGAPTIPVNGITTLTFTITNPAANPVAETGVAFSDTFPSGMVVATPNGLVNTVCGGTVVAVAGSGSISLSGGSVAVGSFCTINVSVSATASGTFTNTTGAASSTNGGTGNTASATLTAVSPPTISKAFGAASIPLNGSTSLTLTIGNPNSVVELNPVTFTDNLPAGLVVAASSNPNVTCVDGTATVGTGNSSISFGGIVEPGISNDCSISVVVQGTTAGVKNNSVTVNSTQGGTGNTATASITVVAPPTISKAFGVASLRLNFSTSLSFTITNPNATTALSNVGFNDPLPAGLVVATPNNLAGSCGGGTITAVAGSSSVSLSGTTLAANSSCTFSVNVTGADGGVQNNITSAVTSTEGGAGTAAAASITVVAPGIPIPSLNRWTLLLLALALAAIGMRLYHRRTRVR